MIVFLLLLAFTPPGLAAPPQQLADVVASPQHAAVRLWECQQEAVCTAELRRVDLAAATVVPLPIPTLAFGLPGSVDCPGGGYRCFQRRPQ